MTMHDPHMSKETATFINKKKGFKLLGYLPNYSTRQGFL